MKHLRVWHFFRLLLVISATCLPSAEGGETHVPSGKYAGESLESIRRNINRAEWAKDYYQRHIASCAVGLRSLTDDQINQLISDKTPSMIAESPNHPEHTPWYIWRYEFPDTLVCKLDGTSYQFDPNDRSEGWNVQTLLRYYRLAHVCDQLDRVALTYRVANNPQDARVVATALKRLAEVWSGYKIHHVNTRLFYDAPHDSSGKISGWVTYDAFTLSACADAYDLIRDGPHLSEAEKRDIESKLFAPAIDFFRHPGGNLGFTDGRIGAGEGFVYACVAKMALILQRTDVIDWIISEVRQVFDPANRAYRSDGWLDHGSIAYHIEGILGFTELAEVLLGSGQINLYEDPAMDAFAKGLAIPVEIMSGNGVCPPNNNSHWVGEYITRPDIRFPEILFLRYHDKRMTPILKLLQQKQSLPYWQGELSLRLPVPAIPPEKPEPLPSAIYPDMGMAVLRHGTDTLKQSVFVLDYGACHDHHGHYDNSSIWFYANGYEMLTDLGYPHTDYTWGWAMDTLSHNTVVVDRQRQERLQPRVHGDLAMSWLTPVVQAVESRNGGIFYPQTTMYRRLVALIAFDEERCFVIDVFRVAGGQTHDWRLQSCIGQMTVSGIDHWQSWNDYADYQLRFYDKLTQGPTPIRNPVVGQTDKAWTAEWTSPAWPADVRFRTTLLDNRDAQIVRATVPASRDYMQSDVDAIMPALLIRKTGPMNCFTAVHESIKGERLLTAVEELDVVTEDPLPAALRVRDGRNREYLILSGSETDSKIQIDGSTPETILKGQLGVVRLVGGKLDYIYLANASSLTYGRWRVSVVRSDANVLLKHRGGNRWQLESSASADLESPTRVINQYEPCPRVPGVGIDRRRGGRRPFLLLFSLRLPGRRGHEYRRYHDQQHPGPGTV